MGASPLAHLQSGRPMGFAEAMQSVIDGKKITKLEWGSDLLYGQLKDGFLMIHLADGWHRWIVSDGDMAGTDWVVVREL